MLGTASVPAPLPFRPCHRQPWLAEFRLPHRWTRPPPLLQATDAGSQSCHGSKHCTGRVCEQLGCDGARDPAGHASGLFEETCLFTSPPRLCQALCRPRRSLTRTRCSGNARGYCRPTSFVHISYFTHKTREGQSLPVSHKLGGGNGLWEAQQGWGVEVVERSGGGADGIRGLEPRLHLAELPLRALFYPDNQPDGSTDSALPAGRRECARACTSSTHMCVPVCT